MRSLLVVLTLTLGCGFLSAEPLSDADREALLERLDALKSAALEQTDSRFRAGVAAYNSAMSSDDGALELYLKCIEKVDFDDLKKKPGEFRDWKQKEKDKLGKESLKLALRHQLHWLSLTIQAASEKGDRTKLAAAGQAAMESVFRDLETLKDQQQIIRQPVTGTVFAKAYEISGLKVDKWPLTPVDVSMIYEQLIMPPLRNPKGVPALRDAWIRRIQQEGALIEIWGAKDNKDKGGERENKEKGERERGLDKTEVRSPEFEKFITETMPKMQWDMEMDLFRSGDQSGAALRMLGHIEKNLTSPASKDWSEQFRTMLTSPGATVKVPVGGAPAK